MVAFYLETKVLLHIFANKMFYFKVSTCRILPAGEMGKYCDGEMINRFLMTKLIKRIKYGLSMATFLSCIYVLMGCSKSTSKGNGENNSITFHFTHEPSNAIYHWKTTFCPNTYERDFIKSHQIKRMYLKFFDVDIELIDGVNLELMPD